MPLVMETSNSSSSSSSPAPCSPANATYRAAVVTWEWTVFASYYSVYQRTGANRTLLCITSGLSCPVNTSGLLEVTASNDVGESPPSYVTGMHFTCKIYSVKEING